MRLGSEANQMLDGGEGSALSCIVGREFCLFTTLDAHKVPDKQRDAFVSLAVKRAAPFSDPEFGVAWTGPSHAAVWYWSREAARLALAGQDGAKRVSFSPEPIFVGAAQEDAAELLALAHGVEGRVWKQGRLVSSKWWAAVPEARTWQTFLRSAGIACGPDTVAPAPSPAPIAARSWARAARGVRLQLGAAGGLDAHLPRALLALAVGALAVYGFQLGSLMRNQIDAWRAESAARNLDAPLQRILDARQAADRNQVDIDELLALRQGRPQVMLMAEATRLLPQRGVEIRRWSQPAPERIELSLTMQDANPEQLVSAWEASPLFDGVTTDLQPRSNQVTLRANVVTAAAPEAQP